MELSLEEFKKINELEAAIDTVEKLTGVLVEHSGEKEFLIEILSEKTQIMKNKFDDFIFYFNKK